MGVHARQGRFRQRERLRPWLAVVRDPVQTQDSGDCSLAKGGSVKDIKGKAERERPRHQHGQRSSLPAKSSQLHRRSLQTQQILALGCPSISKTAPSSQDPQALGLSAFCPGSSDPSTPLLTRGQGVPLASSLQAIPGHAALSAWAQSGRCKADLGFAEAMCGFLALQTAALPPHRPPESLWAFFVWLCILSVGSKHLCWCEYSTSGFLFKAGCWNC